MRADDIREGQEYACSAPLGSGGYKRKTGINRQIARMRVEQIDPDGTLAVARPKSGTKYRYQADGVLRSWSEHQQQKRDALQAAELCKLALGAQQEVKIKGNGSHGLVEISMGARTAVQLLRIEEAEAKTIQQKWQELLVDKLGMAGDESRRAIEHECGTFRLYLTPEQATDLMLLLGH